jgi:hypothetical protein
MAQYRCNDKSCKLHYTSCYICKNIYKRTNSILEMNHRFNTNYQLNQWYCTVCITRNLSSSFNKFVNTDNDEDQHSNL